MSNVIVEHLKTIIMAFWNMKTWSSNGAKVQSYNLQLHKTSPWLVAFFRLFPFCVGWIVFSNQAFKPVTFAFKRIPPPCSQNAVFKCRTNMWETFGSCNRATRLWQKYPSLHWMLPDQAAHLPYSGRRQEPLKAAAQIARLETKTCANCKNITNIKIMPSRSRGKQFARIASRSESGKSASHRAWWIISTLQWMCFFRVIRGLS